MPHLKKKSLLRFITCGSVDDGKSTLIGRLLYEANLIQEDQLEELKASNKKYGTAGEALDLALLVDGLLAEREEGITIDVAYRFFSTRKRKFIVADTPGHEQYTRNMATGASTADLAIVMVDARKGLLPQTKRHSFIVSMFGIKNIVVVVNKMDLVDYDQKIFNEICDGYKELAKSLLNIEHIQMFPVSSLYGDNIVYPSENFTWYKGPCLLEYLEDVNVSEQKPSTNFRLPVQWINRPHLDFRGVAGSVVSGSVSIGDQVKVLPSGKISSVAKIVTYDGELQKVTVGQAVTIVLNDEIDVSRGDIISSVKDPCEIASQFSANILWISEQEMIPSRQYIFFANTVSALCVPSKPKHKIDINTTQHVGAKTLGLNEMGVCDISLNKSIGFEAYENNKDLGSFILVDRITNETVAAGLIIHSLRRSTNVHRQDFAINQTARAELKGQKPFVLWFTGLPSSGKSTIADALEVELNARNKHTMLLDGDNLRHGISNDLGFTEQDRAENMRRVAEISKLMVEAGLITLVTFVSPFKAERRMAKELIGEKSFIEIFVDTSLEEAERRDVKGLYKKARAGKIPNFTGVGSRYEKPEHPDIWAKTQGVQPKDLVDQIIQYLLKRGFLDF